MSAFAWTAKRERAALLVAQGRLTGEEIAGDVGIAARTLDYWKDQPEFLARVALCVEALRQAVLKQGISDRVNRVRALNDRWERMQRVIEERALAPDVQNVAGGTTGLLVHHVKGIGSGANLITVDEFELDDALLRELRAHEEQAAKELGQWIERGEISGPGGSPIPVAIEESISRIYGNNPDDKASITDT
jgi:hypothetical protein